MNRYKGRALLVGQCPCEGVTETPCLSEEATGAEQDAGLTRPTVLAPAVGLPASSMVRGKFLLS